MAFTYDLEKDLRYQQGMDKGMERGMERGLEKGVKKGVEIGVEEEKIFAIRNMVLQNFATATIGGVLETTEAYIEKIKTWMAKEDEIARLLGTKQHTNQWVAENTGVEETFVTVVKRVLAKRAKK